MIKINQNLILKIIRRYPLINQRPRNPNQPSYNHLTISLIQDPLINILPVTANQSLMGNQQSVAYKDTIYEDEGKYIIPTKIKPTQNTEQAQILKNIFGVQDPALLTRSYWAKLPNAQRNLSKSPAKSKRLLESSVGPNSRHHQIQWAQQSIARPEREILAKSIVSNFRQDLKETPSRKLSKITSCSIISKLNQFEADLQSTSPLRHHQKPSTSTTFTHKNKQNMGQGLSGSPVPSNKRLRKTQGLQNSGLQKSRLYQNRQSQVKDYVQSQVSHIFGGSNVSGEQEQLMFGECHKGLVKENNERIDCPNCVEYSQNNREVRFNHNQSSNHEICEQTFSKFDQNPALLCSSLQDKASQKSNNFDILSKKTHSKHSEIQKFDGLNEDSKNESLMKVLKKITQISLDNPSEAKKPTAQIKTYLIRENASQIMHENIHSKHQVASKRSQKPQTLKSQSIQKYEEAPFEFYLHEVKNSTSKKSSNAEKQCSNKSQSNFSQNNNNLIFSEAARANSKSLSKFSVHQLTEAYAKNGHLLTNDNKNMFECLDNEESQQTDEKVDNSSDDYFRCLKLKSPKSITSEQVGLNRQRSCAGRIVETSKAVNTKEYSSPFKSKKYDFSKKQSVKNDKSTSKYDNGQRQTYNREGSPSQIYEIQAEKKSPSCKSPSHRSPSHRSPPHRSSSKTLDYQLMMKISTLEGELNSLKKKQDREKFESRRYSPVKQEKWRKKPMRQQASEQENQEQEPKYSINEFSRCTPFKRRAQYFKLKLK